MAKLYRNAIFVVASLLVGATAPSSSYADAFESSEYMGSYTYQTAPAKARKAQARQGQPRYYVVWAQPRVYTRAEIEGIRVLERMN